MGNSLRNIGAVAGKELRSYFGSPTAWVMMGFFAFLFGYFFATYLSFFVQQSMQAQFGGGAPNMNVNMQMIRPLLGNASVLVLFLLPMVTMRTYSEEKRSGTIELLLTSRSRTSNHRPGKFVGALTFYAAMLACDAHHVGILFIYGTRSGSRLPAGISGCSCSGLLHLGQAARVEPHAQPDHRRMITFGLFLVLWVIDWIGSFGGPTVGKIVSFLSITGHFDDFAKGVIDTTHLVYYLSFITFGLFLTAKAVDSERWRDNERC
jgi:ABC-2 type transport system permease protein